MTKFSDAISSLINETSREKNSNTPDFILAEFVETSLQAFEKSIIKRDKWYTENHDEVEK